MKTIGTGATCAICNKKIWAGETYLSNWGDDSRSVHTTCNLRRIGLDQSNFNPCLAEDIDVSSAARAMGRKGGLSKSAAKTAAVRENGKKGGRPRKQLPAA
jgi:hypothetical protein